MVWGRLIPAHAGKTSRPCRRSRRRRAHPRSRGENLEGGRQVGRGGGSSPLTRGKRVGAVTPGGQTGLIPAHAGKTAGHILVRLCREAHPRSRGENLPRARRLRLRRGSSPLTRGKPLPRLLTQRFLGLIPAHAGKTQMRARVLLLTQAHPRSRGENAHHPGQRRHSGAHPRSRGENRSAAVMRGGAPGSSPLTRGKRLLRGRVGARPGLIPAHAGKTDGGTIGVATGRGSSPLTRGKHPLPRRSGWTRRLIPAHAGKTPAHALASSVTGAHPRSRGENPFCAPTCIW